MANPSRRIQDEVGILPGYQPVPVGTGCLTWHEILPEQFVQCEREHGHGGAHTAKFDDSESDSDFTYVVSWWRREAQSESGFDRQAHYEARPMTGSPRTEFGIQRPEMEAKSMLPIRWFKSERTFVFDAFGVYVIGLTGRDRPSVEHFIVGKWRSRKLCSTCGRFKARHNPECPDA